MRPLFTSVPMMSTPESSPELPHRPLGESCVTLVLAWLVPGLGHIFQRDVRRGIILLVIVQATFGLGLLLHGAVLWPVLNPSDWGANALNCLTFLMQLGNGLAALVCLGAGWTLPHWADATRAHTLFELGSVYLLVAGAVNHLTLGMLYDRHLRRGRRPLGRV